MPSSYTSGIPFGMFVLQTSSGEFFLRLRNLSLTGGAFDYTPDITQCRRWDTAAEARAVLNVMREAWPSVTAKVYRVTQPKPVKKYDLTHIQF